MFINFAGVCEGMAMGAKAGIDPQALLDVIKTSTSDSMYLRRTIDLLLAGEDVNSAGEEAGSLGAFYFKMSIFRVAEKSGVCKL